MFKVYLLIALAVAGARAQNLVPAGEAAPEPYAYSYETDTHAAQEQRDPAGRVSGYYTLVGDDGRQRRVEYIADEGGFRAKVQTNEVGTKSENSADVEIQAAPPTQEQLAQTQVVRQQSSYAYGGVAPAQQRVVYQQNTAAVAPAITNTNQIYRTVVAPQQSGAYYAGYYGAYPQNGYGYNYRAAYGGYNGGYNGAYNGGYNGGLYSRSIFNNRLVNNGAYYASDNALNNGRFLSAGNYNYHTPGQYYEYYRGTATGAPAVASARYATSGIQAVPLSYSAGPVGVNSVSGRTISTVAPASSLSGSSNYIVLKKKRESGAQ